jgi:hypothetical protein
LVADLFEKGKKALARNIGGRHRTLVGKLVYRAEE